MTSEIEQQLTRIEGSLPNGVESGLAMMVCQKLSSRAKGLTTDEELESFVLTKIGDAERNLDHLELMEYPDSATEMHVALHTAFVLYSDALETLQTHLWGGSCETIGLEEVFARLYQGDRYLQLFQGELDERLAPMAGIDALW